MTYQISAMRCLKQDKPSMQRSTLFITETVLAVSYQTLLPAS